MSDEQPPQRRAGARPAAVVSSVLAQAADAAAAHGRSLEVLDLGGGTGGVAVPLAEAGHHVTVVDPSPNALAALARRAGESGVSANLEALQGDGDSLGALLAGRRFDLVCCHGVLEFVDDPVVTLGAIKDALTEDGTVSLLVAGRLAAVLAKALAGELTQAKALLTDPQGRWGSTDPLPRRFDLAELEDLLAEAGLVALSSRGTSILSHLVPASLVTSEADRDALSELDSLLVTGPGRDYLRTLGHGLHVVARRA